MVHVARKRDERTSFHRGSLKLSYGTRTIVLSLLCSSLCARVEWVRDNLRIGGA